MTFDLKPGDRGYIDPRRYVMIDFVERENTRSEVEGIPDEKMRAKAYELYDLRYHVCQSVLLGLHTVLFGWGGMLILITFDKLGIKDEDYSRFFQFFGALPGNEIFYSTCGVVLYAIACGLLAYWINKRYFERRKLAGRRVMRKLLRDARLTEILMDYSPKLLADARNMSD